ncbi:hypothetical protein GmHk_18G052233 [Glycine max]|nr:hypothetical protein GmHk_18G052233 [Glycine max]KAH1198706.1 hypothetical protein GmHk_18G052233 [Glycine max]KAH1198707.1 hypothetical protein GmHk_18G052233 [Glycine max]KAH1198708.1 hypothetical protein GmHk_18G052233 [Glycine max]
MDIIEMGYVIASRYNVILVSLSRKQSMTFFPLRSQPPPDSSVHRMICVGHVFGNHFVQAYKLQWSLHQLLCTVGRTPDEVINLLERTTTPTHDALLYYNGRWNMPPQNKFVGCTFTRKNPKKFEIPSGCTLDELKDLIKQVAPKGIPPHEIP